LFTALVPRHNFQIHVSLRSLIPFDCWENRFVCEQKFSQSIIGFVDVDGNLLCLPVPPDEIPVLASPSLRFLDTRMGDRGLTVKRTNCSFGAENAKICLDAHF